MLETLPLTLRSSLACGQLLQKSSRKSVATDIGAGRILLLQRGKINIDINFLRNLAPFHLDRGRQSGSGQVITSKQRVEVPKAVFFPPCHNDPSVDAGALHRNQIVVRGNAKGRIRIAACQGKKIVDGRGGILIHGNGDLGNVRRPIATEAQPSRYPGLSFRCGRQTVIAGGPDDRTNATEDSENASDPGGNHGAPQRLFRFLLAGYGNEIYNVESHAVIDDFAAQLGILGIAQIERHIHFNQSFLGARDL